MHSVPLKCAFVNGFMFSPLVRRKAVNHYDLLGVKTDASFEEIKNAFFEKSKKVGLSVHFLTPVSGSLV